MNKCKCGSYAINHNSHGRDGSDGDLCDLCYWRKRAEATSLDAERYRWLKSRVGLTLTYRYPEKWTREDGTHFFPSHYLAEGGTQHAPAESLDEMIDAAMAVSAERDASCR